jgi:hypothetical protein
MRRDIGIRVPDALGEAPFEAPFEALLVMVHIVYNQTTFNFLKARKRTA